MATRFAITSGDFNNPAIWDNNLVPLSTDDVYTNGFNINVNQNITAVSLRSTQSNVYLPNIATPAMTSNTAPTGTVISSNNSGTAYYAFNQDNSTNPYWNSGVANTGWLGYTFSSGKVIKRYFIKQQGIGQAFNPKTWTFEGSNDGFATAGVKLDEVLSYTTNANYTSVLLANTTAYTSYRINITAAFTAGSIPGIAEFEMTESTTASPVYGAITGGSFLITDSKNVTLTGTQGLFSGSGSVYALNVNTVYPNVVNINCGTNFLSYLATGEGSAFYLSIAGSGTTNITGNVYRTMNGIVSSTTTGIVNITGTITSGARGSSPVGCVILSGSATYNITGSLLGDPISSVTSGWAVAYTGTGILNINGIITANSTEVLSLGGTGTTNITGAITGSAKIAVSGGTSFVNILTGTITAGTGNNAISNTTTGLYTLGNSPLINTNNILALFSSKIRFDNNYISQWRFQNQASANVTIYSGTGTSSDYPAEDTVRFGSPSYGPTLTEYNGTMRIPAASNVNKGVEYGYGEIGTAVLTAEDFLDAISTSTNPMAIRLKNISTTQTMGDQLSGFSNA